ncbi:hypothetical protein PMY38_15485 [Clostridium tertium]|jgi:hypothetical protein|uniref:hypothetical protein n=1 Tax=Clostridium TaxID=1485 RepID=UPI000DD0194B|nr:MULTISPECIES: hypothetical protein [Clostridium]DAO81860.1 MAG TPA: hypothetical protein [Caudoviricetes sp.]MDB1940947.1 hypothetical protein [Clostridium tertium]MDB1956531.1 hypothetical protein [Clostridium tertium]MDB1960002.1 hypothetical protein [Clostridium tertium]MDB1962301.1 hypothetical protein [Clostridium tertium]
MKKVLRKIKKFFISENSIRNISLISIFLYLFTIFIFKGYIESWNLDKLVNGDLFNISGVLAGFIFTGLGFIVSSDSNFIKNIKITNNFDTIKSFYIYSIYYFIIVIVLYLIQPIVFSTFFSLQDFYKEIYLLLILQIFITALILFAISLYILNITLSDN